MDISIDRIRHWAFKGGLGILDQGLYSGANFLMGVLLARWLSPASYGAYSAAYSIFLLISIFQVSLIAEPMSVFGARRYSEQTVSYLNYLLRLQWIGSFLGAVIIILFALLPTNSDLREALFGMALSLPFILFYWYLRRAFYIEMQSGMAMIASSIYSGLLLLIILAIQSWGKTTIVTAYIAMALSSLIASLFALKRLGISFWGRPSTAMNLDATEAKRDLWNFGKWVMPAYLASWLTSMAFPFLISVLLSSQLAGAFRALHNLYLPFQQFLAAITLLILPWLAKQQLEYGNRKMFTKTQIIAGMATLIALLYCFITVIFRQQIIAFLYESRYYSSFDYLVIYLALATLIGTAPLILGLSLRVINRPKTILWSKGGSAIFVVLIGFPLISVFRMDGVSFALIGSAVVEAAIVLFYYLRIKVFAKFEY